MLLLKVTDDTSKWRGEFASKIRCIGQKIFDVWLGDKQALLQNSVVHKVEISVGLSVAFCANDPNQACIDLQRRLLLSREEGSFSSWMRLSGRVLVI